MIKLLVNVGADSLERELHEDAVTIGRSPDVTITLDDRKVSRQHALIEKVGSGYRISSLEPRNPVKVNGQEVTARMLAEGDEIGIGDATLVVLRLPSRRLPLKEIARAVKILVVIAALGYGAREAIRLLPPRADVNRAKRSSALEDAEKVLAGLHAEVRSAEEVPEELVARVADLAEKYRALYPSDPAETPFDLLRDALVQRRIGQVVRLSFEDVEIHIVQALQEFRYGEVLEILRNLKGKHDSISLAALLDRVNQEIRRDFTLVDEFGRKLEGGKQYALAADHYRAYAARFRGTEHYRYLSDKPEILGELEKADAGLASRPPLVPVPAIPEEEAPEPMAEKPSKPGPRGAAIPSLTLVSATARGNPTQVTLLFSEPVDQASAEAVAHYAIEPGVKVLGASRSALNSRRVTLTTSALEDGRRYALTISSVKDCAPVQNLIAARREFIFVKGIFNAPKEKIASERRAIPPVGPSPRVKGTVLFNTPEADQILPALQIFPRNNPWNEDISKRPVHPDSNKIIASIGPDKNIQMGYDMSFILVPPNQPRVPVMLEHMQTNLPAQGSYPIPDNAPIGYWPMSGEDLADLQRGGTGGRHMILVDPANGLLHEFYLARRLPEGWDSYFATTFKLNRNERRPLRWPSADAAGLPIFPSLPRYDECERGVIGHALRFTVRRTRSDFIYPATHQAGTTSDRSVPAMGQRFRLKAGVEVADMPNHARVVALALKKHGMFVADNGSDWLISCPADVRLDLTPLERFKGGDFEVVVTTGEREGPRAGGN
jgi:hypothetical protein